MDLLHLVREGSEEVAALEWDIRDAAECAILYKDALLAMEVGKTTAYGSTNVECVLSCESWSGVCS